MGKGKVLIADDSKVHYQAIADVLGYKGYECLKCNVKDAPTKAAEVKADQIILELKNLDDIYGGIEILRNLKADNTTSVIPVIILTTWNKQSTYQGIVESDQGKQLETLCMELGAVDYITKPFSNQVLRDSVEKHILQH